MAEPTPSPAPVQPAGPAENEPAAPEALAALAADAGQTMEIVQENAEPAAAPAPEQPEDEATAPGIAPAEEAIPVPPLPPEFPVVASGRRKTAVATVWVTLGTGRIVVNERGFEEYFASVPTQSAVLQPLRLVDGQTRYDVRVKVQGGGIPAQAGATRMALARALIKIDPASRAALKEQGCLRRDARMKERKKSGQPGARKRFQFSKR